MSFLKKVVNTIKGLRKWSIMLLIIIVGVIFRIYNLVNGTEFVTLIVNSSIAFFGANIVEHIPVFKKTEDMSDD